MLWNWSKIPIIITKTGHQRSQDTVRPQSPHLHGSQTTWKLPAGQELTLSEALSSPSLPSIQALISRPEASSKSQLLTSEHTRWFYIKHQLCVLKSGGFSFYSVTQHAALEERPCDCWHELCRKSKGKRASLPPKPEIGPLCPRWQVTSSPHARHPYSSLHTRVSTSPPSSPRAVSPPVLLLSPIPVQLSLQWLKTQRWKRRWKEDLWIRKHECVYEIESLKII